MNDNYAEEQEKLVNEYILDMRRLLPMAKLKQEFLFDNAIPARAITVILGQPGSMKSWLAYELAIATSRGHMWLDRPCSGQGSTLILNYDNPTPELARRLKRLGAGPNDSIYSHTSMGWQPMLQFPQYFDQVQAIVRAIKPRLIIIDSLRQSHLMEEVSSKDMALLMGLIKRLTEWGSSIVLVHHCRKTPAGADAGAALVALDAMRGSSEIAASSDCVISVKEGSASWIKTRGWYMPEDESEIGFDVSDDGEKTLIQLTE